MQKMNYIGKVVQRQFLKWTHYIAGDVFTLLVFNERMIGASNCCTNRREMYIL